MAADLHPSAIAPKGAREDRQRRRLTRAVWPEETDDLAALHGERNRLERTACAVALLETIDDDGLGHGGV